MPLILPGNVATATASTTYEVANSCRFDDGDQSRMNRDLVTATSRQKFTYSFWIKRCSISQQFFVTNAGSTSHIKFDASHRLDFMDEDGNIRYITNRLFRDVSAWYSIIIAVDTTQGTAGNRVKIYINGTQETSFSTSTAPDQNYNCTFNTAVNFKYGSYDNDADYNLDGYLAEVVFIDGSQEAATSFGEFDSDSPRIWKPIDVSGLTFGTNGHYLDFEASGNLGNDANGGTDWTEENLAATDQSTDTCTNNFCVMNSLDNFYNGATFSEGNCQVVTAASPSSYNVGTFGVSSGKWFWEVEADSFTTGSDKAFIGISSTQISSNYIGQNAHDWSFTNTGNLINNDEEENGSYGSAWSTGDIIGVALNLDDNELKFYVNGTVQNSGTAVSITAAASTPLGAYFPAAGDQSGSASHTVTTKWNFGASYPAAISSGNADGNGYGNFEYAVPSGFFSLCTKNLAEYGG